MASGDKVAMFLEFRLQGQCRDLNACNRQGTRLRKNYKVTQTLKTGATVKIIYFSRGGGVMKTTNLRQIDLRL